MKKLGEDLDAALKEVFMLDAKTRAKLVKRNPIMDSGAATSTCPVEYDPSTKPTPCSTTLRSAFGEEAQHGHQRRYVSAVLGSCDQTDGSR